MPNLIRRARQLTSKAKELTRSRQSQQRIGCWQGEEVSVDPAGWNSNRDGDQGVETLQRTERVASVNHPDYPGDDPCYHHDPSPGKGTFGTAERLSTLAPVMGNPSLDPAAGSLVQVSYMCGYGGEAAVGHDAIDGVDRLVTGEADANGELEIGSATEGGPLELAPDESVYEGRGHNTYIEDGEVDYCAELRCGGEGWL